MQQLAGVPKENLCGFGLLPFFLNWSASPKVPPSWILRTRILPNRCEASSKGLRSWQSRWDTVMELSLLIEQSCATTIPPPTAPHVSPLHGRKLHAFPLVIGIHV